MAAAIGFRTACKACEFLALASKVITVRLVGFMLERGTPSSGRLRAKPPAEKEKAKEKEKEIEGEGENKKAKQ